MTRFTQLILASAAVVLTSALASGPAGAQAQPYAPDERRAARERFQQLPPEQQERVRERMRERRGEVGRELSSDERRQLRRDIAEHGREVYRERPGPGGGGRQMPRR